jgi:hypothetical protein
MVECRRCNPGFGRHQIGADALNPHFRQQLASRIKQLFARCDRTFLKGLSGHGDILLDEI